MHSLVSCLVVVTIYSLVLMRQSYSLVRIRGRLPKLKIPQIMSVAQYNTLSSREIRPNTVLILSGATSVGKSSVAMELCRHINGEIVISDSVQVYKHLDIGSNKPTVADMEEVPHHLVGINEPCDQISTGDYARLASQCISDILRRGKVPVVVGGATMWLQWLVHGIPDAPKATPAIVQQASSLLEEFREKKLWEEGFALVAEYDPVGVTKFERNDWYRLQRCLEIALQLKESGGGVIVGTRTSNFSEIIDFRTFFVCEDRSALYRTIDSRCLDMLRLGHLTETAELLHRDILLPEYPVAKSIGYRQTIEYLARGANDTMSSQLPGDTAAFETYFEDFCSATRSYARRQINWHRKDKKFLFVEVNRPDGAPKEVAYRKVAEEVWHWATVPREEFDAVLAEQIAVGDALTQLLSKKNVPYNFMPDTPAKRKALSWLIVSGAVKFPSQDSSPQALNDEENRLKKLEKRAEGKSVDFIGGLQQKIEKQKQRVEEKLMARRENPGWVACIQDESLGVTPNQLKSSAATTWSAKNGDIRIVSGAAMKEAMKRFTNEALVGGSYSDLIEEADKLREGLLARKRDLLVRFLQADKCVNSEEDS